ncbi:MAG: FkbM family methyltransferase [Beijerinckiaceae bacterium]
MELLHKIPKLRWLPVRHWYDLRGLMRLSARVRDPEDGVSYTFEADSFEAYQRGRLFLTKEPRTIAWLRTALRPDDVFLDIGANIGIFSVFAGKHIGPEGHVYACEPHLPTAAQLLQNISANGLGDRVSVLSIAASGEDGFAPFLYKRWRQGASGSQLAVEGGPGMAQAVGSELKTALKIDTMVERGVIRPPNLIKIDTDGIEIPITRGMEKLLRSPQRPRALLIEIQEGEHQPQVEFMASCGYRMAETHPVGKWKRRLDAGATLDEIAFNALFAPNG